MDNVVLVQALHPLGNLISSHASHFITEMWVVVAIEFHPEVYELPQKSPGSVHLEGRPMVACVSLHTC